VPDFHLALNNALSIQNFNADNVLIYPNPSNEYFFLKLPSSISKGEIVLYTNLGRKVIQQQIFQKEQQILVSGLASGVYMFEFTSNNTTFRGKIMKQ
jgi:hypothetical protein